MLNPHLLRFDPTPTYVCFYKTFQGHIWAMEWRTLDSESYSVKVYDTDPFEPQHYAFQFHNVSFKSKRTSNAQIVFESEDLLARLSFQLIHEGKILAFVASKVLDNMEFAMNTLYFRDLSAGSRGTSPRDAAHSPRMGIRRMLVSRVSKGEKEK